MKNESEELMALIKKAEEEKDTSTLAKFQAFGKGTRQQAINYYHYQQWLSCGYQGKPIFNEYGWLKNEIPIENVEVVQLWKTGYHSASVSLFQLPNGKWVNGYSYMLSESGSCVGCSIWRKQYATRQGALNEALDRIKGQIENGTNADKKHLADLTKARQGVRELSLF